MRSVPLRPALNRAAFMRFGAVRPGRHITAESHIVDVASGHNSSSNVLDENEKLLTHTERYLGAFAHIRFYQRSGRVHGGVVQWLVMLVLPKSSSTPPATTGHYLATAHDRLASSQLQQT